MDRLSRTDYERMPWAPAGTRLFLKPAFEEIASLKKVPLKRRRPEYSEFYELEEYLRLLAERPAGLLLDLGAGCGSLSFLFSRLGWDVVACDLDHNVFGGKRSEFVKADLNLPLPFARQRFDAVVCKQCVEHLENPSLLFREVRRVLRAGCSLTLSTPNIASLSARVDFLLSGVPTYYGEPYWREHRTLLHHGLLRSLLEEAGFGGVSFSTNRYELASLDAGVNGLRRRFLAPLVRLLPAAGQPEPCRWGQYLVVHAT